LSFTGQVGFNIHDRRLRVAHSVTMCFEITSMENAYFWLGRYCDICLTRWTCNNLYVTGTDIFLECKGRSIEATLSGTKRGTRNYKSCCRYYQKRVL